MTLTIYVGNNPVAKVDTNGDFAYVLAAIPVYGWIALGGLTILYGGLKVYQKGGFTWARSKAGSGDPAAKGRPHARYKTKNKKVTEYTTYDKHGKVRKQFRGEGKPHGNVSRPNVKSQNYYNRNPKTGKKYPKEKVRKPYKKEYPRGYR